MEIDMQGLWKENVSGWNNKDSKRKKQKRKHFFKEKFSNYLKLKKREDKKISSEKFGIEGIIERTSIIDMDSNRTISEKSTIFLAEIEYITEPRCWKIGYNEKTIIQEKVYFENDICYIFNKGILLVELGLDELYEKIFKEYTYYYGIKHTFKVKINLLKPIDVVTWDISDRNRFKIEKDEYESSKSYETFYGKRIPRELRRKYYRYKSKTNKYTQKLTNGKRRTAERNYIQKADFEQEFNFTTFYGWDDYY